jgi:hypothetical protein
MHFVLRISATMLVVALTGAAAEATPAAPVVVAQGVDPTTLDPHNHQESPAANLQVRG